MSQHYIERILDDYERSAIKHPNTYGAPGIAARRPPDLVVGLIQKSAVPAKNSGQGGHGGQGEEITDSGASDVSKGPGQRRGWRLIRVSMALPK